MTELVFILDRSGSMAGMEADTIGGFNSLIEKQLRESNDVVISTVLFDNHTEIIHDRLPLEKVPKLTDQEYTVRGCTALLDAVGGAIHHIGNVHKYARPEDRPKKTLFFITTDGMENASRHYDYDHVRRMITRQQEKYGWEFIFLGADIDVAKEAGRMGIRRERALSYRKSGDGIERMYSLASDAVLSECKNLPFDNILKEFSKDERNK